MRGVEQAREYCRVHRIGTEVAHVAPLADHVIDRIDVCVRIAVWITHEMEPLPNAL